MWFGTGSDGMNNIQAGLSLIRWELIDGFIDAQVQNTMKTKSWTGQWVWEEFKVNSSVQDSREMQEEEAREGETNHVWFEVA